MRHGEYGGGDCFARGVLRPSVALAHPDRHREGSRERGRREVTENGADRLSADLILVHAPSVYDFRERDDVLFAYLSDSDSVNVTSIYEMYPIGFLSMKQRLREQGFRVEIVNIASLMLQHPDLDVDELLRRLDAPVIGFDLHWMAQCHGSIELAKRVKTLQPEVLTIFGGISATYYADELIRYPDVDMVIKGYDTLEPLTQLMRAVRDGDRRFSRIPNVLHQTSPGTVDDGGFTHKPMRGYNDATIDWSWYQDAFSDAKVSKLIMTLPNTGCAMDCGWCGGSRYAYKNTMGVKKTVIHKDNKRIVDELRSMGDAARTTSIYALQCYSESKPRMHDYLDGVKEMGYKSVFFEQFSLTPDDTLQRMGESIASHILLSPESHELEISRLSGRGNYTMAEMEEWIPRALDAGVKGVMIWFFIGMPKQSPK